MGFGVWRRQGQDGAVTSVSEEPRALVCAFDLASADWAGADLPWTPRRPWHHPGCHAPLAYFCPSVSCGCCAGLVLRNTAALPSHTPAPFTPQKLHSCFSHRPKQRTPLCTDTNESRSAPAPKTHRRSNSPAGFVCVNTSLPELCSQPAFQHLHFPYVFSGLKPQLPCSSLCRSPTLSLAVKKRCLRLPRLPYSPPLPSSCPSHLTLPALCSLTINREEVPKLFHPCGIGWMRRKRRWRGLFAGEELELALMLASGLWSTQLRGIRSTVHLSAALQWNNIPCPTNLRLFSSPLFPSQIQVKRWLCPFLKTTRFC